MGQLYDSLRRSAGVSTQSDTNAPDNQQAQQQSSRGPSKYEQLRMSAGLDPQTPQPEQPESPDNWLSPVSNWLNKGAQDITSSLNQAAEGKQWWEIPGAALNLGWEEGQKGAKQLFDATGLAVARTIGAGAGALQPSVEADLARLGVPGVDPKAANRTPEETSELAKQGAKAGWEAGPRVWSEVLGPVGDLSATLVRSAYRSASVSSAPGIRQSLTSPEQQQALAENIEDVSRMTQNVAGWKGFDPEHPHPFWEAQGRMLNGEDPEKVLAEIPEDPTAEFFGRSATDLLNFLDVPIGMAANAIKGATMYKRYYKPVAVSIDDWANFVLADGKNVSKAVAKLGPEAIQEAKPGLLRKVTRGLNPLSRPNSTKASLMLDRVGDVSNNIMARTRSIVKAGIENPDVFARYADIPVVARAQEMAQAGATIDDIMLQITPDIAKTMAETPEVLVPLAGTMPISAAGRDTSVVLRELTTEVDGVSPMMKLESQIDELRALPVSEADKAERIATAQQGVDALRVANASQAQIAAAEKAVKTVSDMKIMPAKDKADQMILAMSETMYDAVGKFYPTKPISAAKRAQNSINNFLSTYMFMGFNPAYALRNGSSNITHLVFDGTMTFDSSSKVLSDIDDYLGFVPAAARRDIVGAAGVSAPQKTTAPFLKLSNDFERDASTRAVGQSLRNSWRKWERPQLAPDLVSELPESVAKGIQNDLALARNEEQGYAVAQKYLKERGSFRYIEPEQLQKLRDINENVAAEVQKLVDTAATPEDWQRGIDNLRVEARAKATQVVKDVEDTMFMADEISPEMVDYLDDLSARGKPTTEFEKMVADRQEQVKVARGELFDDARALENPQQKDSALDAIQRAQADIEADNTRTFAASRQYRRETWARSNEAADATQRTAIWNEYDRAQQQRFADLHKRTIDRLQRARGEIASTPVGGLVTNDARLRKEAQAFKDANRWGGPESKTHLARAFRKQFPDVEWTEANWPSTQAKWEALPDEIKAQWNAELDKRIGVVPTGTSAIKVTELNLDPARFQYKLSTDQAGVTPLLKGVKEWNPDLGRGISYWVDPADGKAYVVNGHHRVELAQRLGVEEILSPYRINAATPEEARMVGAMQNIAEGRGTPIDAAKIFREIGATTAELPPGLSMREGNVRRGLALSGLHDSLFNAVVRQEIPLERAVLIGEKLPNKDMQIQLVQQLDKQLAKGKNVTNDMVSELIDAMLAGPQETVTQATLFGEEVFTRSNAFERAEFLSYTKNKLGKEKRLFEFAAKNATDLERVGSIDRAASQGISNEAAQLLEIFDRIKNQRGVVSDVADEAASVWSTASRGEKEQLYERIVTAIQEELGQRVSGDIAGAGGVGTSAEDFTGTLLARRGETAGGLKRGAETTTGTAEGRAAAIENVAPLGGVDSLPERTKVAVSAGYNELPEPARSFLRERGAYISSVDPTELDDEAAGVLTGAYAMTERSTGTVIFNAAQEFDPKVLRHESLHLSYPHIQDVALERSERFVADAVNRLHTATHKNSAMSFVLDNIEDVLRRGDRQEILRFVNDMKLSEQQKVALRKIADRAGILYHGDWDLETMLLVGHSEMVGVPVLNEMPELVEELVVYQAIEHGFDEQLFDSAWRGWQATPITERPGAGVKPGWLPQRLIDEVGNNPLADAAHASAKLNGDVYDVLNDIGADVTARWGTDLVEGIPPETYDRVLGFISDEWVPSLNDMRSRAIRVAQHERDFALHNYADRRNIDIWIHNLAPYFYWPSRTYPKWALRFIEHPRALANYMRYRDMLADANKDLPEWYRHQIRVQLPFMDYPIMLNIEQTLNPLYQLTNSFQDRDRLTTDIGKLFSEMSDVGAMPWAPLVMSLAMARAAAGEPEEAAAWLGYASPVTRAVKSATALAGMRGGEGITLEPWMWEGIGTDEVQAFSGMDKWDWRRVPKKLYEQAARGELTLEELAYAEYKQEGEAWDRAKAAAIQERAPSNVISFLLGAGFRGRTPSDVEIERADQEWYELKEKAYAEDSGLTKDQIGDLFAEFEEKYPFFKFLRMGRRGEVGEYVSTEQPSAQAVGTATPTVPTPAKPNASTPGYYVRGRAEEYANNVLLRLPPGNPGRELREKYLDADLVQKWYDSDMSMQGWSTAETERFMTQIEEMGFAVMIPTTEERALYEQVKGQKSAIDGQLAQEYGEDIFDISNGFPYNGTKEDKRAYLSKYPDLSDFWEKRRELRSAAGLDPWYGSQKEEDPKYAQAKLLFGDQIWDQNSRYFDIRDKQGKVSAKNYLSLHPELKRLWDWLNVGERDTRISPAYSTYQYQPQRRTYGGYGNAPMWKKRGGAGKRSWYGKDTFPWWLYKAPWLGPGYFRT